MVHKPQEMKDSDEKEDSAGDDQIQLQKHLILQSAASIVESPLGD
jgi:hypothetical protein